jgi:glucan phosphoethanolaminetransferase (alkaline phosphatase superfamily)
MGLYKYRERVIDRLERVNQTIFIPNTQSKETQIAVSLSYYRNGFLSS